jgi:GTP cyclohydrolase I
MLAIPETIVDCQNFSDIRNLRVNRVGIQDYQHPVFFSDKTLQKQPSVGLFRMLVDLPPHKKGTHMSRFIEILHEAPVHLSIATTPGWLERIVTRLDATESFFSVQFPLFLIKTAPVSRTQSLMNYQVMLSGSLTPAELLTRVKVVVPVTSLCPCSKTISDYGAHNQRSHMTVEALVTPMCSLEELIGLIEQEASCELYSILKRPDEKQVTERAYNNPKFVEDVVRDVAQRLQKHPNILNYKVESVNFESIHNHSAYAMIQG